MSSQIILSWLHTLVSLSVGTDQVAKLGSKTETFFCNQLDYPHKDAKEAEDAQKDRCHSVAYDPRPNGADACECNDYREKPVYQVTSARC